MKTASQKPHTKALKSLEHSPPEGERHQRSVSDENLFREKIARFDHERIPERSILDRAGERGRSVIKNHTGSGARGPQGREDRKILKTGKRESAVCGAPRVLQPFPREMLALLRCSNDAGELMVVEELRSEEAGVLDAVLECKTCATKVRIEDGIARLLTVPMSAEDQLEMRIRDKVDYEDSNPGPFIPPPAGWRSVLSDKLEVTAHLDELELSSANTVLELACGDGRFTALIARAGAKVLAVDFSINALRLMAHRLPPGAQVGRVHANINHLRVAHGGFDRALAATPLDSRDERMGMFRTIAEGLTERGRFVGSFEHDDLNRRLLGLPVTRRYSKNGILIEHLTKNTLGREVAPYFSKVLIRPIRPRVPLVNKFPHGVALAILRVMSALPIVRNFGELLLVHAERPVRSAAEGERRVGSAMAKSAYKSYMKRKRHKALWGEEAV